MRQHQISPHKTPHKTSMTKFESNDQSAILRAVQLTTAWQKSGGSTWLCHQLGTSDVSDLAHIGPPLLALHRRFPGEKKGTKRGNSGITIKLPSHTFQLNFRILRFSQLFNHRKNPGLPSSGQISKCRQQWSKSAFTEDDLEPTEFDPLNLVQSVSPSDFPQ